MTRSIVRVTLTMLALVLMFAGSFNLKRTSAAASDFAEAEVVVAPAPGLCQTDCGCPGGPQLCCTIWVENRKINCGMPF